MIEVSPDLIAFLRDEYDRCRDEALEDERETAIERYNGQPYGDEEDGRSQVVARDTAETCDYMVISILRTIVSGDRVVEFAHRNAEAAHQATETIMHLLMDDQDGYQILHDWLKAGLLEKAAVAMTYGEPQPPKRTTLKGVSALALSAMQEQGARIVEGEENGEDGPEGPLFDVVIVQDQPPKFRDAAIPNEEFYCSPDARTITEAQLKGRRVRKTVSDLTAMKFDAEAIGAAGDDDADDTIGVARDEGRWSDHRGRSGAARTIWWHEEYARFDANGDGIAELLYIQRTSDYKIFAIEEIEDPDDHPFEDWCPFPMPHRRIGQSLADKVMDIERIRTVLLRQSLDGIYLANNPSTYVHEDAIGENTIEDLLTVRPGRLIRWRGAVPPVERSGSFDAGAGFHMLEFMNGERESRTGITRLNQGLDADALNKTATGTALMQAQGQQVEEYLARNFANALARLFTKKAKLLKRYGHKLIVPIDGEHVEVDPAQWPEDMIARPRVGLGSGRKEQRLAYRRELIGYQMNAMQAGLGIVDSQSLFNSAKGFVKDTNLGDVAEFFKNPSRPDIDPATGQPVQRPEKLDPQMAKVQGELQARQTELQMKQMEAQAQLSLKQQEAAERVSMARENASAQLQLRRMEAQFRAQTEQARAQFEAQLAQFKAEQEFELEKIRLQMTAHRAEQDCDERYVPTTAAAGEPVHVTRNRQGGQLDE